MTWARQTIERPVGWARGFEDEMARAVTGGMSDAALMLKERLAEATWHANGWKNRLPKTWRARVFPRGQDSIDAAAWVDTRAPKLMRVFAEGATITAQGGKWLAIPTEAAGAWGLRAGAAFGANVNSRGVRARVTPAGFERRTGLKLRFVSPGGGYASRRAFLVVDQAKLRPAGKGRLIAAPYGPGRGSRAYGPAGRTIVVFVLVRRVRLKQKLDVAAEARAVQARLPDLIRRRWRD